MIRRHPITGDPILFAPDRAHRPNAFAGNEAATLCPFCPGNEHETPPEILRCPRTGPWRIRVVPNRYPVLPRHDVIIESDRHEARFEDAGADIVAVYAERYAAMVADESVQSVALFRNDGPAAGATIPHPHAQIIGLPFVPPRMARERAAFGNGACPLCSPVDERLITCQNESFLCFAPDGSAMAYQQWIVPKRHLPDLQNLEAQEVQDLESILRHVSRNQRRVASSSNWIFMNFAGSKTAHFYIDVVPRLTTLAGFELGTGTFIDIIDPVVAAATLR